MWPLHRIAVFRRIHHVCTRADHSQVGDQLQHMAPVEREALLWRLLALRDQDMACLHHNNNKAGARVTSPRYAEGGSARALYMVLWSCLIADDAASNIDNFYLSSFYKTKSFLFVVVKQRTFRDAGVALQALSCHASLIVTRPCWCGGTGQMSPSTPISGLDPPPCPRHPARHVFCVVLLLVMAQ